MKKLTWFLAIGLGVGLAYYEYATHRPIPIKRAVEKHYVEVTLKARDAKEVTATFTRTSNAPSSFTLVIAPGTMFENSDPKGQRLMAARTVKVALSIQIPEVTTPIETYCVDHFGSEPTIKSSLSFIVSDDYVHNSHAYERVVTEPNLSGLEYERVETEPIQKLARALENSNEPRSSRQIAVWLIAGDYQNKTYDDVYKSLCRKYEAVIRAQLAAKDDEVLNRLRGRMPNFPKSAIEQALWSFRLYKLDEALIKTEVERLAKKDLKDFVKKGGRVLKKYYDPKIENSNFFSDARARGFN